jgi:hypothetical protein
MRIESTADVVPFTLSIPGFALIAFSEAIGVPRFENTADIVTFPADEVDEEIGLVVLVQPANTTEINNEPINFRDSILKLLFLYDFIQCAEKNNKSTLIYWLLI